MALGRRTATGHGHGHGHRHLAPAIGWVLTVPFVLLAAVPPTPVGAWSADRVGGNADAAVATAWTPEFAPLDPHAGVHVMSLRQFWERAAFDPKRSLSGLTVRLTGFVGSGGAAPDAGGEGWSLTRMAILCCAADAFPLTVRMLGAASPAAGQWVEVEGVWAPDPAAPAPDSPEAGRQTPRLRVLKLTPIAVPARPYDEPPP